MSGASASSSERKCSASEKYSNDFRYRHLLAEPSTVYGCFDESTLFAPRPFSCMSTKFHLEKSAVLFHGGTLRCVNGAPRCAVVHSAPFWFPGCFLISDSFRNQWEENVKLCLIVLRRPRIAQPHRCHLALQALANMDASATTTPVELHPASMPRSPTAHSTTLEKSSG